MVTCSAGQSHTLAHLTGTNYRHCSLILSLTYLTNFVRQHYSLAPPTRPACKNWSRGILLTLSAAPRHGHGTLVAPPTSTARRHCTLVLSTGFAFKHNLETLSANTDHWRQPPNSAAGPTHIHMPCWPVPSIGTALQALFSDIFADRGYQRGSLSPFTGSANVHFCLHLPPTLQSYHGD